MGFSRYARVILIALGILGLILALLIFWLSVRPPLSALPQTDQVSLIQAENKSQKTGRTLRYLTLNGGSVGKIHAILSLPKSIPKGHRLPVMIVLGGLSAKENLQYLPDPGQNAVLLYDWPFQTYLPSDAHRFLQQAPGYYQQMSRMPGQIAALMAWAKEESWADPQRISLLGFSLGAMAAPAAQRIAERQGTAVHWTVLAYGGSPIGDVLMHHPTFAQSPSKPLTRTTLNLLTRHIDPGEHLPYLHGRFLVIYGLDDQMVPAEAAQRMHDLTPKPKTTIVLKSRHLGIWQQEEIELLNKITNVAQRWLIEQGAITPP